MRFVKNAILKLMAQRNYHIVYEFPDRPSGISLQRDLSKIVTRKNPVCIDVGANLGQTIDWLKQSFDRPKIYSIEPSSSIFSKLQNRFNADPNVMLLHCAMGSAPGKLTFKNYSLSELSSLLPLRSETIDMKVDLAKTEEVEVKTIDHFVAENKLDQIDILKIDTQGFDLEVLKGAKELLSKGRVHTIMTEMNFLPMYENQGSVAETLQYLEKLQYRLVGLYEVNYRNNGIYWCNGLFVRSIN